MSLQFIDVNDATSHLLRYSKAELLKMSLYDLLSKEEGDFIRMQLLDKGNIYDREAEITTKDGEKKKLYRFPFHRNGWNKVHPWNDP